MTIGTWLGFAVVALIFSALPGPAFITVLSSALRSGWRAAPFTIAGIVVGDAIYFSLAALGLGAVLVSWHPAFIAIKWLGIAYLTYLGLRAIIRPESDLGQAAAPISTGRRAFSTGLATQLANPKIIIFLGALVPQFINPAHAVAPQFAILGVTFMVSDAIVFTILSGGASQARRILMTPKSARVTSRVAGAAMLTVAGRIAVER